MSHNQVTLLLGTNLGDRNSHLETARSHISRRIGEIIKKSETIETAPLDFVSDNQFLNQAVMIETNLSPFFLLKEIKSIEKEMGRIYTKSNSDETIYEDRTIDIDILTYNNLSFESKHLTIPHHQVNSRNFVKKLLRF